MIRIKVCRICGVDKPESDYCRRKESPDGLRTDCKQCRNEAYKKWQSKNPERAKAIRSRWAKKNPDRVQEIGERWKERNRSTLAAKARERSRLEPEKCLARRAVSAALLSGRLLRQPCERCGSGKRTQAHHEDYSKPLSVNWLCASCHQLRHREIDSETVSQMKRTNERG